jgi:hypothetical protein
MAREKPKEAQAYEACLLSPAQEPRHYYKGTIEHIARHRRKSEQKKRKETGRLPPRDQRSYPPLDSPAITHAPSLISPSVATDIIVVSEIVDFGVVSADSSELFSDSSSFGGGFVERDSSWPVLTSSSV